MKKKKSMGTKFSRHFSKKCLLISFFWQMISFQKIEKNGLHAFLREAFWLIIYYTHNVLCLVFSGLASVMGKCAIRSPLLVGGLNGGFAHNEDAIPENKIYVGTRV